MRFKIVGVLLLLAGLYFAGRGWWIADQARIATESAKVDVLIAIFLASTVRVLQAEKHHREHVRHLGEERPRLARPDLDDD
ncbi:MAG: hypothetical protein LAN37_06275 [Acidobacteriia bacterium]|jgi:hypothetical protein|nr:hypothetical protein [Terriglobia bacterium]